MEHEENQHLSEVAEQHHAETSKIALELENARREIADLQSHIQWLERSYE